MFKTVTVSKVVEVEVEVDTEVDIDVADLINEMGPADLAEFGLAPVEDVLELEATWTTVRNAMRRGDRHSVDNLLSAMAWNQAGVVLPAIY